MNSKLRVSRIQNDVVTLFLRIRSHGLRFRSQNFEFIRTKS